MAYTILRLCCSVSVLALSLGNPAIAQGQESSHSTTIVHNKVAEMTKRISANSMASPWNGSYVGVMAGYGANGVHAKHQGKGLPGGLSFSDNMNSKISANSFEGGIIGGYGKLWGTQANNPVYTGFELSGDASNAKETTQLSSQDAAGVGLRTLKLKIQKSTSLGAAVRVGKIINNSLIYGKIGAVSTRWSATVDNAMTSTAGGSAKTTKAKWLPGLVLGAGAEMPLNDRFLARAEYAYTLYSKMKVNTAASNPANYSGDTKFSPSSHIMRVGVVMPLRWN